MEWCRLRESNPRPTDYKSVALPSELSRHAITQFNSQPGRGKSLVARRRDLEGRDATIERCWFFLRAISNRGRLRLWGAWSLY